MRRSIRLLALVLGSCLGAGDVEQAHEHNPWTTGDLECFSADGCPAVRCGCNDGTTTQVRACLADLCLDDHHLFCRDYCNDKGGRARATIVYLYACLAAEDRTECLGCRDEAARECNSGICEGQVDALVACIDAVSPELPSGVESYEWDEIDGEVCTEEREAHRACLADSCPAFGGCEQYPDYHPPIAK